MKKIIYIIAIILLLFGCEKGDTFKYDFNSSDHGWVYGHVDYDTTLSDNDLMLNGGYLEEHELYNSNLSSLWLIGNNNESNLTFYVYKEISGLDPNVNYEVEFNISIITPFNFDMNKENNLGIDSNAYLVFIKNKPETITENNNLHFTDNTKENIDLTSIYISNMSSNKKSIFSENLYVIDKNISTNFTSNKYGVIYPIIYIETSRTGLHTYAINNMDFSISKKAK